MRRYIAWLLVLVLCLGLFTGCGKKTEQPAQQTQTQTPEPTPEVKDDGKMKILMIGASLGHDSMYLLPEVLRLQGVENFVTGILYHSASLGKHANYLKNDEAAYAYFEYVSGEDTVWRRADCYGNFTMNIPGEANDKYIEDGSIAVKAEFAMNRHDWDVVVALGGSSEVTGRITGDRLADLHIEDVNEITKYVLDHDIEPGTKPKFAWHMVWALPQDDSLLNDARRKYLADYYDGDAMKMFEASVAHTESVVAPYLEGKFDYILPTATAFQNAKSSAFVEDKDIHRDYIHATDYGRLIAAYTWYCGITGTDINDCKFGPIHYGILMDKKRYNTKTDLVLTEQQQNILIESIENAYQNPYKLTKSQYQ